MQHDPKLFYPVSFDSELIPTGASLRDAAFRGVQWETSPAVSNAALLGLQLDSIILLHTHLKLNPVVFMGLWSWRRSFAYSYDHNLGGFRRGLNPTHGGRRCSLGYQPGWQGSVHKRLGSCQLASLGEAPGGPSWSKSCTSPMSSVLMKPHRDRTGDPQRVQEAWDIQGGWLGESRMRPPEEGQQANLTNKRNAQMICCLQLTAEGRGGKRARAQGRI